jgi:hypothetical protein
MIEINRTIKHRDANAWIAEHSLNTCRRHLRRIRVNYSTSSSRHIRADRSGRRLRRDTIEIRSYGRWRHRQHSQRYASTTSGPLLPRWRRQNGLSGSRCALHWEQEYLVADKFRE